MDFQHRSWSRAGAALALSVLASSAAAAAEPQRRPVPLREALQLAAKQGPDVAAARAQAAITRVGVERAFNYWKPDISATGTYDHVSAPSVLDFHTFTTPIGAVFGLTPVRPDLLPPPIIITATNSRYGTLQLTQPFFTPRGVFQPGIANSSAESADRNADQTRENVLLSVARTYLTLQGIEGLLAAAYDAEKVALRREQDARAQIAAGTAVELNLLRAQNDTAVARSQIASLLGQQQSNLPVLEALVGEPIMPLPAGQSDAQELGKPADEASEPWERTFGVQSAIAQLRAAQRSVTYDNFLWLPSVSGVARGSYTSNLGFNGTNTYYDLIVNVNIPLYDQGARYAQKHEDQARLQQSIASLASTRAQAKSNWQAARANLISSQAVLEQNEAQVRVARRAQVQTDVSFRAGVATSLDLQDADNRLFQAQSSAAQARANLDISRASVAAAEGRLYADSVR
ncbi:MAG TPA: TolC family protein [Myxococcales bacterium]|nr:TolC family protein [Myxococcales bacterium]